MSNQASKLMLKTLETLRDELIGGRSRSDADLAELCILTIVAAKETMPFAGAPESPDHPSDKHSPSDR